MKKKFKIPLSVFFCLSLSCSREFKKDSSSPEEMNSTKGSFYKHAKENHLPVRILLALSYVESGINSSKNHFSLSPQKFETAFGLREDKDFLPDQNMSAQIQAYSLWLKERKGELLENPKSADQKFEWIWLLAGLHKKNPVSQIIFAREMIQALNSGFYWFDPESKSLVYFEAEIEPILIENMSLENQDLLALRRYARPSIDGVRNALSLIDTKEENDKDLQKARSLQLIHCPYTLSTCLELQDDPTSSFKAHYLVPQNPEVEEYSIATAMHQEKLNATIDASDKIVIALTGYSGKQQEKQRSQPKASWMSPWQLLQVGLISKDICKALSLERAREGESMDASFCSSVDNIEIQRAGFGKIQDFSLELFSSYFDRPTLIKALEISKNEKIFYRIGEEIELRFSLPAKSYSVDVYELKACKNNSQYWKQVEEREVGEDQNFIFKRRLPSSGVQGVHAYRFVVRDLYSQILAWENSEFYMGGELQASHLECKNEIFSLQN